MPEVTQLPKQDLIVLLCCMRSQGPERDCDLLSSPQ